MSVAANRFRLAAKIQKKMAEMKREQKIRKNMRRVIDDEDYEERVYEDSALDDMTEEEIALEKVAKYLKFFQPSSNRPVEESDEESDSDDESFDAFEEDYDDFAEDEIEQKYRDDAKFTFNVHDKSKWAEKPAEPFFKSVLKEKEGRKIHKAGRRLGSKPNPKIHDIKKYPASPEVLAALEGMAAENRGLLRQFERLEPLAEDFTELRALRSKGKPTAPTTNNVADIGELKKAQRLKHYDIDVTSNYFKEDIETQIRLFEDKLQIYKEIKAMWDKRDAAEKAVKKAAKTAAKTAAPKGRESISARFRRKEEMKKAARKCM